MFKTPQEKDYITDEMIDAFRKEFANDISSVQLSQGIGSGRITIGRNSALVDMVSGQRIPVRKVTRTEDYILKSEYVAEVLAVPGIFGKYRWDVLPEEKKDGDGNETGGMGCCSIDLWSSRQPDV